MSTVEWVAVGQSSILNTVAILGYSYNGFNWYKSTSGSDVFSRSIYGVVHNGDIWVACGNPWDATRYSLAYSYDGINWTGSSTGRAIFPTTTHSVDYGNNMFVAAGVGPLCSVAYSYDGINWTNGGTNSLFGAGYMVKYVNSIWFAYGWQQTTIRYSYDGINWLLTNSIPLTGFVSGLDYNGSVYVAVGTNTAQTFSVMYSSDGISWSNTNVNTVLQVSRAIKWDGTRFLVVGNNTGRMRSTNGINWSSYTQTGAGAKTANSINYNPTTQIWMVGQRGHGNDTVNFIGTGIGGAIVSSSNGTNWSYSNSDIFPSDADVYGIEYRHPPRNFIGSIPSITSLTYDPSNVYINFSPSTGGNPPPTTYYYSINNGTFVNANTTTSPITITGLSIGVNYSVRLIATNIAGNTAPSNSVSTIINAVGIPPTITSITSTVNSFVVSFTPSTGGYPAPTTYQYSLNNDAFINANTITSPITIQNVSSGLNYPIRLIATNSAGNTVPSNVFIGFIPYPCFKQGTKILRMNPETDDEEYVRVETLRQGDLIRTVDHGYKAIELIGSRQIEHPLAITKNSSKLYWFRKSKVSGLKEDLCVTGDHCILHKSITDSKKDQVFEYMSDIYITEGHYRVPAFLDDRSEPYADSSPVTIWHFALENTNIYHNYGVMANGLLVESSSLHYMYKYSNMELI